MQLEPRNDSQPVWSGRSRRRAAADTSASGRQTKVGTFYQAAWLLWIIGCWRETRETRENYRSRSQTAYQPAWTRYWQMNRPEGTGMGVIASAPGTVGLGCYHNLAECPGSTHIGWTAKISTLRGSVRRFWIGDISAGLGLASRLERSCSPRTLVPYPTIDSCLPFTLLSRISSPAGLEAISRRYPSSVPASTFSWRTGGNSLHSIRGAQYTCREGEEPQDCNLQSRSR